MLNKVTLIGRLGRDPESRTTPNGKKTVSFSIATTEGKDQTTWHNVIAWEKLAELCEKYLQKGSLIYVEGRISNRSYFDKDNVKRHVSEIVAHEIKFLDKKPEEEKPQIQSQFREEDIPPF
jgi:single-strand DNA-binding protein